MTIATIKALERCGVQVKISDVSSALNLPRPGVTRTVREMEDRGYLRKTASDADGRITYLSITDAGKALSQTYNENFFSRLAPLLAEGYAGITLVDIRYVSPERLGSWLTFDRQDVLLLYSAPVLNNSETIK